jgi:hypothetical protein
MHTNELTYNELSASQFLPNDWGHIDLSGYSYLEDEEVCFKLAVWSLQCKFGNLIQEYFYQLEYGTSTACKLDSLLVFKWGLEVLNRYNPRDITMDTTDYNVLQYSTILKILQTLHNKY